MRDEKTLLLRCLSTTHLTSHMLDPALSEVIKLSVRAIIAFVAQRPKLAKAPVPNVETVLSRNVIEALQWASTLQIFGMTSAADPESATIPLRLAETPRRFRGTDHVAEQPESHILQSLANIILLGDPGSGKTTTLKRLTKQLVTGNLDESIPAAVPVVLRLRDLREGASLVEEIAIRLGLQSEWKNIATTEYSQSNYEKRELWIGQERAKDVIGEFLGEQRTLLILDGLDEFPGGLSAARRELNWLALVSQQSQVIVTCRSGDYTGTLEGYKILELCPLTPEEVDKVIEVSGVLVSVFRSALEGAPYRDLVDRPLFLAQLLLLYRRYGYLPRFAFETYSLIIGLMLREWDAERSIPRISQYASFSSERKRSFLAAVSYFLSYKTKKKSFTTRDLAQIYSNIHSRFGLPKGESHAVVSEIESHTGLVVVAGYDRYEFSHLSLQEYLAAEYISREANSLHVHSYLREYPAPVAVALTLVSDASEFFGTLFLSDEVPPTPQSIQSFIHRLLLERPIFEPSALMGAASIRLASLCEAHASALQSIYTLFELSGAKESLVKAFSVYHRSYSTEDIKLNRISLQLIGGSNSSSSRLLFSLLQLSQSTYNELISIANVEPQEHRPNIKALKLKTNDSRLKRRNSR